MAEKRRTRIASIPGDGIGRAVVPEGLRVLRAAASAYGFDVQADAFDVPCIEAHGRMMPQDLAGQLQGQTAIFFGAVGWLARSPSDPA